MYSFILEATRILNIWAEYIFGKKTETTVSTSTPKYNTRHLRNLPKLIHLPAYKGDAEEQFDLGVLCYNSHNYQFALLWYWLAARQGHAEAQFLLGLHYEDGEIIGQDYVKAVKWFKRSAEKGFVLGQNNYAWMLIRGDGIERDYREGLKWYKLAAEQGFYKAQFFVGLAYFFGDWSSAVKQNFQEAAKWFRLSADQGYPDAQFNLGLIYHQ